MNTEMEQKLIEAYSVRRYLHTTLYSNDSISILSPYVGNEYDWFDIRDISLNRIPENRPSLLIIRHKIYGFLQCDLTKFKAIMAEDSLAIHTPHSGKHWKYRVKEDNGEFFVQLQRNVQITCAVTPINDTIGWTPELAEAAS